MKFQKITVLTEVVDNLQCWKEGTPCSLNLDLYSSELHEKRFFEDLRDIKPNIIKIICKAQN